MRILVIGGGGREDAIIWKLFQSPKAEKIYCIPGNGGIEELAECIPGKVEDIESLVNFAKDNQIDMTIVGPELPLTLGIVDTFEKEGLKIFGPHKKAAQLEGSKAYAKSFMEKYNIPTAQCIDCKNKEEAYSALEKFNYPIVIKADGLACGKGVIIAQNNQEARKCISEMMIEKIFGDAGKRIIIEEFLEGREISLLAFLDFNTLVPMVTAQDYKRALDNDQGLNTGGMGAVSPSPIESKELQERIYKRILSPTFEGIKKEGLEYRGVLYFGLMITKDGPKLLEYNVRFGDPETQAILPRLDSDLMDIIMNSMEDRLSHREINWKDENVVTITLTSGGYPQTYKKGKVIAGLDKKSNAIIFHGGTIKKEGFYYTNGGRVLNITALDTSIDKAAEKVYRTIDNIYFDGMHYRKDIGLNIDNNSYNIVHCI